MYEAEAPTTWPSLFRRQRPCSLRQTPRVWARAVAGESSAPVRAQPGCGRMGASNHHPVRFPMPSKPTPQINLDLSKLLGFNQAAALAAKVGKKPNNNPPPPPPV